MPNVRAECPFCDARRFIRLQSVRLDLWLEDRGGRGTDVSGEILGCLGCGRVELFVNDPEAWLQKLRDWKANVEVIEA